MIKTILLSALLLVVGRHASLAADDLRLIIAPKSTILAADGHIDFDAYLYNASKKRVEAPAPQASFNVIWALRDPCKHRPDRNGTHFVIGTDTKKQYVLNPGTAAMCELSDQFSAQPTDLLEFHITIDRKLKSGDTQTISSNSVMLYRAK